VMKIHSKDQTVIARLGGFLLYLYSEMVSRTCRFSIEGVDILKQSINDYTSLIFTSWHGMTMMLLGSMRKYIDPASISLFFPDDVSGKALAKWVQKIGIEAVLINLEGDSSLKMSRKLLGVIRDIKSGRSSMIHPDGPKGPAYNVKPGITAIARMTGAAIIPVGCYCRNAYHFPRWDRYSFPLPFSKIQIQVGSPITISRDMKDMVKINHNLEDTLNRLAFQAAAKYYVH
jgi:lysophospholipid acyltransferase (LPLAT)-like uncharacterized protein